MCGIIGIIWRKHSPNNKQRGELIGSAMLNSMRHRGPDSKGLIARDSFTLGHLRLSIIDIESASQPMVTPDGKVLLSYNGEIYGFEQQLKQQKQRGWQFKTHSDTETLLAGYIQSGADFDYQLNGMYAYVLVDQRDSNDFIQLGIDPVGIKPLFIAKTDEAILIASELRGIVSGLIKLGVPPSIDTEAITEYLALGWVPPPRTMLRSVRKLAPGERCRIDLEHPTVQSLPTRPIPPALTHAIDLDKLLENVIRRQIVSDAPLGFFLSGGIDSSLLVAKAQHIGIQPKTFTVRFAGEGHGVAEANEADIAQRVADYCNADHYELSVTAQTLQQELDTALIAMDQPIADPACLPLLVMARFAREHVKVCLSGDGGDELFLGYPRHRLAKYKAKWQRTPSILRMLIMSAACQLPSAPSQGLKEKLRKLKVGINLLDASDFFTGPFSGNHLAMLTQLPEFPPWSTNVANSSEAFFEADMLGQLAGQMLPKTDHVTMYASLETRVPFLDLEMIQNARAIPTKDKLVNGQGKTPLRSLLSQYLPPEITKRPKRGFRVPLSSWFRYDLAKTVQEKILDINNPAAGLIDRKTIETLLTEHMTGRDEHSIRIWSLLALQSWLGNLGNNFK